MGIESCIKQFIREHISPRAFLKTLNDCTPLTCIGIEDLLIRLHSWSGANGDGLCSGQELYSEIMRVTVSPPNGMDYLLYVLCMDNQARVPNRKKTEQDKRDKIIPYPEGCWLSEAGIHFPDGYTHGEDEQFNVLLPQPIQIFRLCRSRHMRPLIMKFITRVLHERLFDKWNEPPPSMPVIFDSGDGFPVLWDSIKGDFANVEYMDHSAGESDIAALHWMQYLMDEHHDIVLHTIDGDWIVISMMAVEARRQWEAKHKAPRAGRVYFCPNSYSSIHQNIQCIDIDAVCDDLEKWKSSADNLALIAVINNTDFFDKAWLTSNIGSKIILEFFRMFKRAYSFQDVATSIETLETFIRHLYTYALKQYKEQCIKSDKLKERHIWNRKTVESFCATYYSRLKLPTMDELEEVHKTLLWHWRYWTGLETRPTFESTMVAVDVTLSITGEEALSSVPCSP